MLYTCVKCDNNDDNNFIIITVIFIEPVKKQVIIFLSFLQKVLERHPPHTYTPKYTDLKDKNNYLCHRIPIWSLSSSLWCSKCMRLRTITMKTDWHPNLKCSSKWKSDISPYRTFSLQPSSDRQGTSLRVVCRRIFPSPWFCVGGYFPTSCLVCADISLLAI